LQVIEERYQLEKLLGNGRLGELYRATDTKLSRQVAVRLINPDLVADAEKFTQLRQSITRVTKLKHAHIGLIYHAEWEGKRPFIVTDFATRPFLNQPLPVDQWFVHAFELASVLVYGHDEIGVIHGGIQDGNVLVREGVDPRLILTDWGITPVLGISPAYRQYAPPEVLMGKAPDKMSDIYSMGAVLYQSLVGTPPDPKEPLPLVDTLNTLPKVINDFVLQLLSPTPARRVPSAKEALSVLHYLFALTQNNSRFTMPHETELVINAGAGKQRIEPMVRTVLSIGSDPQNDVVLRGGGVTNRHARLEQQGVLWFVTDLGSSPGTVFQGQQMLPNSQTLWQPEDVIGIGTYNLLWRPVSIDGMRVVLENVDLSGVLEPAETILTPEEPIYIQFLLTNHEETVLQGNLTFSGLPPDWFTLPDTRVQLLPGGNQKFRFLLQLPIKKIIIAGTYSYHVGIEVREQSFPLATGQFTVPSQPQMEMVAKPQQLTDKDSAYISVRNTGNTPIDVQLTVRAAEKGLTFRGFPATIPLAVGGVHEFFLEVQGKRPFIGSAHITPFTITPRCHPESQRAPRPETIHFQARPRISTGAIALFSLFTMFLCMGLLFLFQAILSRLFVTGG